MLILNHVIRTVSRAELLGLVLLSVLLLLPATRVMSITDAQQPRQAVQLTDTSGRTSAEYEAQARATQVREEELANASGPVNYGLLFLVALVLHSPIFIGIGMVALVVHKAYRQQRTTQESVCEIPSALPTPVGKATLDLTACALHGVCSSSRQTR